MKILFLTDNFPPESNAPASRTYEHAMEWVRMGHKVTVVTGFPNFPQGKVYPGYKNRLYDSEEMSGIKVVRVKTYIRANAGFLGRIIDYCSFMFSGTIAGLFQRKSDVVVATSPQFFCAVGGWLTASLIRKPFVLEIRDMWPESIVAVGVMEDSLYIQLMSKLEHFLYRRASRIVVVTRSFKRKMIERAIDGGKIDVVLNGIDNNLFYVRDKSQQLIDQYDLADKFVVGYIGTHGLAHDLANVLKAVEMLKDDPRIRFLFVGDGAERSNVEKTVAERQLRNVIQIEQQPRENIPDLLNLCDVALVPLKNSPVFANVIPSKIFECQAMAKPAILSIPKGEATEIVLKAGMGVAVEPETPKELADQIRALANDPVKVAEMSRCSAVAAGGYSRAKMANLMLGALEKAVAKTV